MPGTKCPSTSATTCAVTKPFRPIHLLALLLTLGLLAAGGGLLKRCALEPSSEPYSLTAADSQLVRDFEADIQADSIRQAARRQARYDSLRRSWHTADSLRWQHERKRHPMSDRQRAYLDDRRRQDSLRATYPEKYAEGTVLDLNTADSAALVRIPLIGARRAAQILGYRNRLGGFVSARQVEELNGIPPGTARWFSVAANFRPSRLHLNTADFHTLLRHPYLSFEQVKEIMAYRRRFGPLKAWSDLRLSQQFTAADFERLSPYSAFD